MKVLKEQAIKILDSLVNCNGGFDDWWVDLMDKLGMYDELTDTWPSVYDVAEAFGVSEEEYNKIMRN